MSTFSKSDIEAVLGEGGEFKLTMRRGNNGQVQFSSLKDIKAEINDEGTEVRSRDEVIQDTQKAMKMALCEAGLPARISNSRQLTAEQLKALVDAGEPVWVYSPSIWVNQPGSNATRSNPALERKVEQLTDTVAKQTAFIDRMMAALPEEQLKALLAAPAAEASSDEVPL